mmetsp:Transcript_24835/g.51977  ORF Transcript_24835/g.51977 Transcript_24835/m.51977 type:complete len:306 (+) Transcript_24835:472-1389(+)
MLKRLFSDAFLPVSRLVGTSLGGDSTSTVDKERISDGGGGILATDDGTVVEFLPSDDFVEDAVKEHDTSTPRLSFRSNELQALPSERSPSASPTHSFLQSFPPRLDDPSSFVSLGCPILLTTGRTFTFLLLCGSSTHIASLRKISTDASSQRRMHQLSAHVIHCRAMRFLSPRRIFSSEAEGREMEALRVDAMEGFRLGRGEVSSISMRMERPSLSWGKEDGDSDMVVREQSVSLVALPSTLGMVSELPRPFSCPFSSSMRRIMVVLTDDDALSKSKEEENEGMCFSFNAPREVQARTSCCGAGS